jgi:hypothetical protein
MGVFYDTVRRATALLRARGRGSTGNANLFDPI